MPSLSFTVSARTAKLIGQENFANAQGAIIELVKNSYDADATFCIIIFDNDILYMIDNGSGMTLDVIKNEWMTIGTNLKQKDHTSTEGRVKTGAKGIGRFALDRLGTNSTVYTYSKKTNKPLIWKVQWNNFNKENIVINDVKARIREIGSDNTLKVTVNRMFHNKPELISFFNNINDEELVNGTILKIENLKDIWDFNELENLYKSLEVLMPPQELSTEFDINLFSTKFLQDFGNVKNPNIEGYDYKLKVEYSPTQGDSLRVTLIRNELNKEKVLTDYSEIFNDEVMKRAGITKEKFIQEEDIYSINFSELKTFKNVEKRLAKEIGEFSFVFYFFKITQGEENESSLVKYPYKDFISAERKEFLKKFGGIKIFRDNFRVRPYGENGDDWLNLGHRQASNTWGVGQKLGGYKVKPTQVLGVINISRLTNIKFEDKSGREGIQENNTFELFKNSIIDIISIFETDRNIIMHSLYNLDKSRKSDINAMASATNAAKRVLRNKTSTITEKEYNHIDIQDKETLAKAALAYELKVKEQDSEIRMLRNLASVGLIISSFAHEVHNLRMRIVPRHRHLKRSLHNLISDDVISKLNKYDNPFFMIDSYEQDDIKLKHWLDYSLNTLQKDKRKRTNINLVNYFNSFISNWSRALTQRGITIKLTKEETLSFELKSFEVDLDVIFNNLLSNSINALKQIKTKNKEINIELIKEDSDIIIIFRDNGIGLGKEYSNNPDKIFNALETSRTDKNGNLIGTGLGLYLVKITVSEYKGSAVKILETKDSGFALFFKFKCFN
ncbi:ATP-binding protein [Arcobacter ellisii]|uniref:histidine kinase n=1 Tax=Arcobacter ellisii TaxID=913109 RepID=A0A347UBW3_9BACT|nr:ATP-binding protein [Arcobacter ellisii]AXX96341.1 signal transduction sensor histidine kinase [Arcobacter ellisii]RXI31819.1 ATP-binding protein [Arcobacter ellisii]